MDIENNSKRVSTLSNYEGNPFHDKYHSSENTSASEEYDAYASDDGDEDDGNDNFLMAAVNKARKSIFQAFAKDPENPP